MAAFVKKDSSISYEGVNVVMDEERFYSNRAEDFRKNNVYLDECGTKFSATFITRLRENRNKLLKQLTTSLIDKEMHMLKEDVTVYTGICGIIMLYLKIAEEGEDFLHLKEKAMQYLSVACENEKYKTKLSSRPTFLCGLAGPWALYVVNSVNRQNTKLSNEIDPVKCVKALLQVLPAITTDDSVLPNEILYGRSGYLYALLYIKNRAASNISNNISDESIKMLALSIIQQGVHYVKQTKRSVPMWWEWHDKEYIGAAHGVGGILFVLLAARAYISEEMLISHIKPTLDYFVSLQYPSGNFPSSISGTNPPSNDKLLHWCHGAPGVVHLLLRAHKIWPHNEDSYLLRAKRCGETIWKRGLLKKGYGLCHGVAGNTYAFLGLWKATNEAKYLYQAAVFAEWCFEYGKRGCRAPDRPLSLFEGIAGAIYLLSDLLQNPSNSEFPAFCEI